MRKLGVLLFAAMLTLHACAPALRGDATQDPRVSFTIKSRGLGNVLRGLDGIGGDKLELSEDFCYAVHVTTPGSDFMKLAPAEGLCSNAMPGLGIVKGLFKKGDTAELEVPIGIHRRFDLIGIPKSQMPDATCAGAFEFKADKPGSSRQTVPYYAGAELSAKLQLVATATVEIQQGDNHITLIGAGDSSIGVPYSCNGSPQTTIKDGPNKGMVSRAFAELGYPVAGYCSEKGQLVSVTARVSSTSVGAEVVCDNNNAWSLLMGVSSLPDGTAVFSALHRDTIGNKSAPATMSLLKDTRLVFSLAGLPGTSVEAGADFGAGAPVTVTVKDKLDYVLPGHFPLQLKAYTSASCSGTASAHLAFNDPEDTLIVDNTDDGVATFSNLHHNTTGSIYLQASLVGSSDYGDCTGPIVVGAGPALDLAASTMSFYGLSASPPPQVASGNAVTVRVTAVDTLGNLMTGLSGLEVSAVAGTSGSVFSPSLRTAAHIGGGVYQAIVTAQAAGAQTVFRSRLLGALISSSVTAQVIPGPGSALILSSAPSAVEKNSPFDAALKVLDAAGNTLGTMPAAVQTVKVDVYSDPVCSVYVQSTGSVAPSSNPVTVPNITIGTAGVFYLKPVASVSGLALSMDDCVPINVFDSGAPPTLSFANEPASTQRARVPVTKTGGGGPRLSLIRNGSALEGKFRVSLSLLDANDALVPSGLSGTLSYNSNLGGVTVTNVRVKSPGTGYKLRATFDFNGTEIGVTSNVFSVNGPCTGTVPTGSFHAGDGSASDPYVICNKDQVSLIASAPDKAYVLGDDINMQSTSPANGDYVFTGTLDGAHHVIKNMVYASGTSFNVGLVPRVGAGGVIKDLTFKAADMSGYAKVGVVAGTIEGGRVSGVRVLSGSKVNGATYVGGLVGALLGGVIEQSSAGATVTVTATSQFAGGLAGVVGDAATVAPSTVTQSYTYGSVGIASNTVSLCNPDNTYAGVPECSDIGGLTGWLSANGVIIDSYSRASVSGHSHIGGLVGSVAKVANVPAAIITRSYAAGPVSATNTSRVGGFVGRIKDTGALNTTSSLSNRVDGTGTGQSAPGVGLSTSLVPVYTSTQMADYTQLPWDFGSGGAYTRANAWMIYGSGGTSFPILQYQYTGLDPTTKGTYGVVSADAKQLTLSSSPTTGQQKAILASYSRPAVGKWYFETKIDAGYRAYVGVIGKSASAYYAPGMGATQSWGLRLQYRSGSDWDGATYGLGSLVNSLSGFTLAIATERIGVAVDSSSVPSLEFYHIVSGTPTLITSISLGSDVEELYPAVGYDDYSGSAMSVQVNFCDGSATPWSCASPGSSYVGYGESVLP